jgi:DNA modification methylase
MVEEKLRILENDNRLVKTGKTLREKSYWNERNLEGKICNNLWDDIHNLRGSNNEIIGYDTQKPKLLLERIIKALSNKGDTVADFFCGSGTSLVVAKELGRNYIGCDINPRAIEITESRLREIENGKK